MTEPKPLPKQLLEQRPGLVFDDNAKHPSTHPNIGPPPKKYTKAVHDRICEELRKGQRPQGACARAGITVATFYEWVRRGKEGDPHLWQFAEDVEIAFNSFEASAVDVVAEGIHSEDPLKRDPEQAKWMLERTRSDGYAKQVKNAVEGQIKDFLTRLEAALPPETFELVLAVYLGQAPGAVMAPKKEFEALPAHDETEEERPAAEE